MKINSELYSLFIESSTTESSLRHLRIEVDIDLNGISKAQLGYLQNINFEINRALHAIPNYLNAAVS